MTHQHPQSNDRALVLYNFLRLHNPHLPHPDTVAADPGIEISMGSDRIPMVSLSLYIELPPESEYGAYLESIKEEPLDPAEVAS